MPEPVLVIFDIDGTLLDTTTVTVPAVRRTLARYGLPQPKEADIVAYFGAPAEDYHEWLASLCPEGKAEEIIAATDECELAMMGEEGRLYQGVNTMLDALSNAEYPLAICSNGPADYVQAFLDVFEMAPRFEAVLCRGMGYSGKETMIAEVARRHPGRKLIMVGDRGDDVAGAHANGALAIGAVYGFGPDELGDADALADAPLDVPAAVKQLCGR